MPAQKWVPWAIGALAAYIIFKPRKKPKKAASAPFAADPSVAMKMALLKKQPDFGPYRFKISEKGQHQLWKDGKELTTPPEKKAALNYIIQRGKERLGDKWSLVGAGDELSSFQFWLTDCQHRVYNPAVHPAPQDINWPDWICHAAVVDEYGRLYPGKFGGGSTFAGGLEYIVLTVAPYVALAYPPAAPYIYAGLAAYKARGDKEAWKEQGIAYARTQVPPEYQPAFDIGVGLASGKDPDEAIVDAYINSLPPEKQAETRMYYEKGKEAYKTKGKSLEEEGQNLFNL